MVKTCCVYTCTSESYSGCGISFHSFPKNDEMRLKWLSSIHVKQKITKNSVVCSRHFEPSCFHTANSRQLLKPNAIPTISPSPQKVLKNYHQHKLMNQEPRLKPTASICFSTPNTCENSSELAKLLLQDATTRKPVKSQYEDTVMPSRSSYSAIPVKVCL
ncbi:hypothetical protein PYW07_013285 [Mythimna separata]|uniref:THAP-type domain-containing protein n=1 Tax=Mythimna separata TaxID=271217 RepID=A0AAD8DKA8_MYTSE|nr:hypothetical protein PYW07_013285 [Mythimna separata]